jgi:REP element-mobilizing transposase RayT
MRVAKVLATVGDVSRPLRSNLPERGFYHVTARGVARCSIFVDDDDRALFVGLLHRIGRRQEWNCPRFCLMPNHFHLVLETTRDRLSVGLQRLNGGYAQQFNDRHDRVGHLFQGRFDARFVETDEHLAHALTYVADNPVRAQLCVAVEEWPWTGSFSFARAQERAPAPTSTAGRPRHRGR